MTHSRSLWEPLFVHGLVLAALSLSGAFLMASAWNVDPSAAPRGFLGWLTAFAPLLLIALLACFLLVERRRQADRIQWREEVQFAVTRALATSPTTEEAVPRLLEAICQGSGWELGELWRLDPSSGSMRCAGHWAFQPTDTAVAEPMSAVFFPRGIGLIGKVWEDGEPVTWSDLRIEAQFVRPAMAEQLGLRGACAFPIRNGKDVTGVISLFRRKSSRATPAETELMADIGSQIGQFFERKRAEEEAHHSQQFLQSALDALTTHVAILDVSGTILAVNVAWRSERTVVNPFSGDANAVGINYLQMCESAEHVSSGDGPILALGIRDVIADQYPEFAWEYPCPGDPLPRWFLVRVTRFRGAGPIRVVVAHEEISERKRAEEARRLTEAKYRGIFENAVEGIYQTNVDGRFLTANPMLATIYGFSSPEELVKATTVPSNHFYVDPGRRDEFVRLVAEQQALTGFESQIRRQDGSLVWISENARIVLGPNGEVAGYEGTVVDISDRKRAEETLREANDALRAIIQASPLAIFTLDLDGIIRTWNAAAERMFGWTEEEIKHKHTPLMPAGRMNEFHELMARLAQGEAFVGFQSRRQRKDGSLIDASISAAPLYDAVGRVSAVMTVMADVTDVKKAEGALLEERALLRGLIDSIPDHIFYKDRSGAYLGCNSAFEQYAGRSEKEIVGQSFTQLFPKREPGIHEAVDRQVVEERKPHRLEEWIEYPDGRKMLAEVVKTPFLGPDGQIRGLIGMSRDITERKRLEEGLRQAQKMEAVGQLAGGVAHDFNNLLTAILGNVSLLLQNAPDSPDRELLRDTERAASRAADLTGQLLGFSRKTLLRLEPCNLNTSIDEIVGILRRTIDPRITVEVQKTPALAPVLADPGQMNQVLMNLCLNARDAMPEGGQLVLETANVEIDSSHVRRHVDARAGLFVRLRVRDTGHGIPPDIRPRIFDPFFTTKGPGKGTGLGLAMVFGIVQQHQGWVECQSELGHGTDFEIYLPRSMQAPAAAPTATAPAPAGGHETILLVDDEAVIRNLGRTVLQRHGYRVMLAEDGQEAVGVYRREHPGIDLVILDLTMPRLSGRDTLRQLRQFDPEVRVLFSSGYSAEQIPETGKEGVLGFVNKPYRPQDLVREVRQALDQGRTKTAPLPVA